METLVPSSCSFLEPSSFADPLRILPRGCSLPISVSIMPHAKQKSLPHSFIPHPMFVNCISLLHHSVVFFTVLYLNSCLMIFMIFSQFLFLYRGSCLIFFFFSSYKALNFLEENIFFRWPFPAVAKYFTMLNVADLLLSAVLHKSSKFYLWFTSRTLIKLLARCIASIDS